MKDIPGFEGLYAVTENGRIWSHTKSWKHGTDVVKIHKGRFLNPTVSSPGYSFLKLRKNDKYFPFRVHRLVAMTFLENPLRLKYVNHKNGIKTDNRVENLEWCTGAENLRHSWNVLGNKQFGEHTSGHKLTNEQVIEIRRRCADGVPQSVLARHFDVDNSVISRIHTRKTWAHI